jgi:hypothetical protein
VDVDVDVDGDGDRDVNGARVHAILMSCRSLGKIASFTSPSTLTSTSTSTSTST